MRITRYNILTVLLTIAASVALAACAEMEAHNTKSLLTAAGFQVRRPDTPKKKEIYDALPDQKVMRATVNGKVFYVFKDQEDGIAYVGHEAEYQKYQHLCIQQKIAQQYYMAAQMDAYYARGWYGAWGPRYMYW